MLLPRAGLPLPGVGLLLQVLRADGGFAIVLLQLKSTPWPGVLGLWRHSCTPLQEACRCCPLCWHACRTAQRRVNTLVAT